MDDAEDDNAISVPAEQMHPLITPTAEDTIRFGNFISGAQESSTGQLDLPDEPYIPPEERERGTRSRPSSSQSTAEHRDVEQLIHNVWEPENLQGLPLLRSYQECVHRSLIEGMSSSERRTLRNYLRDHGAPIRYGTGISIYRALLEVLPEDHDPPRQRSTADTIDITPRVTTSAPIYTQAPPRNASGGSIFSQAIRNSQEQSRAIRTSLPLPTSTSTAIPTSVLATDAFQIGASGSRLPPDIPIPASDPFPASNPFVYPPFNPYQWRPIQPQGNRRGQDNNGASRDLLKLYSTPATKYGGDIEENLYRHKREYEMNCMTLQVSRQKALENVYISLRGVALEYYFNEIRPHARNLEIVFDLLQKRFISEDRRQRSLMEWQTMVFKDCKEGNEDDRKTLSRLVNKAMHLQSQLEPRYQSDEFLRDMLLRATARESFAATIHLHTPKTSAELIERMNLSIDARSRIHASGTASFSTEKRHTATSTSVTPAFADELYVRRPKERGRPSKIMFDRRYGKPKFGGRFRGQSYRPGQRNPVDKRTGKVMRCRSCGSETHLLRDCGKASPAQLIYHMSTIATINDGAIDPESILDTMQDMSDDLWFGQASEDAGPEEVDDAAEEDPQTVLYSQLSHNATEHALCSQIDIKEAEILFEKHSDTEFEGIVMDNGAQNTVGGQIQYEAYCRHTRQTAGELIPSKKGFKFGEHAVKSLGIAKIRFPTDDAGNYFEYPSDIVAIDVPLLFGLDLMKKYRIRIDEVEKKVEQKEQGWSASLTFKKGHLYREWPSNIVLFTKTELVKLHRRFAHPTTSKLMNLLKKASPEDVDEDTRKLLDEIYRSCDPCQRMAPKPFVFQVSMPDDITFNHEVIVDLMWLDGKPVLHVVDRGTHYSAAEFIEDESAETVWNTLIECWVSLYTGFPNVISHDKGSVFTSKFFRHACAQFGIVGKGVPVEAHNALSVGERYHAPLRRIYTKVRIQYPTLEPKIALSIAVMGLNNTAGPEGLTPTLLVFGAVPRLPIGHIETMIPSQGERLRAMEYARREMESITATLRLKVAQHDRNRILNLLDLRPGEPVLVFREKQQRWEGPYKFLGQDRKTVLVETPNGKRAEFPIIAVKPYASSVLFSMVKKIADQHRIPGELEAPKMEDASTVYHFIMIHDQKDPRFDNPKREEIDGLLKRGAFQLVPRSSMPPGANILRGRFVLIIKEPGTTDQRFKARFVIQGHKDSEKTSLVTEAPTILKHSIRLLIALAAIYQFPVWTRDVKQAYIQSKSNLLREIYLEPPADLGFPEDQVLRVMKPHYGLTESGSYWWLTTLNYHLQDMAMQQTAMDPCFFFKTEKGKLVGMEASLVDDTLSAGDSNFMHLEEEKSKKFDAKHRNISNITKFSGYVVSKTKAGYQLTQASYTERLQKLPRTEWNSDNFASYRGKLSWLSTGTRPDIAYATAMLSQKRATELTEKDYKLMNSAVMHAKKYDRALTFPRIDTSTIRICSYADAAFGNNEDKSSQLGMVITLCDQEGRCAIVHYTSWKCRRVTRSVLAAEVHAFSACFDFSYALQHDLARIMGQDVPIIMFTDSKCLFDTITKLTTMSEKRLLIDVAALRQSYVNGELFNIGHVLSSHNLADPLTKRTNSKLLEEVMHKGILKHPVNQWIVHHASVHGVLVKDKGASVMSEAHKTPNTESEEYITDDTFLTDADH